MQRNEVIEYIAEIASHCLQKKGVERSRAEDIGYRFADALSTSFGGKQFCICASVDTAATIKNRTAKTSLKERASKKRLELLAFIEKTIIDLVSDLPLKNSTPQTVARHIQETFLANFLNKNLVIPKDIKFKRYQRDQEIIKEFNGINVSLLAEKYGLSENAIYRILKKY